MFKWLTKIFRRKEPAESMYPLPENRSAKITPDAGIDRYTVMADQRNTADAGSALAEYNQRPNVVTGVATEPSPEPDPVLEEMTSFATAPAKKSSKPKASKKKTSSAKTPAKAPKSKSKASKGPQAPKVTTKEKSTSSSAKEFEDKYLGDASNSAKPTKAKSTKDKGGKKTKK